MEHHIGQQVGFVELQLWLDLSSEVARGDEEIEEISSSFRNDILFVWRLLGNIDDLQKARVGKSLGCVMEVEDSKVERWLQCEGQVQATGIWLDLDFYPAEAAGSPPVSYTHLTLPTIYSV